MRVPAIESEQAMGEKTTFSRSQTRTSFLSVLIALVFASESLLAVGVAGASTHSTYPLGKAKLCKAHYVRRNEWHHVKGKRVRFVACVYIAPTTQSTTTTTTATTTASPQYSVDLVSMSPIADGLPVGQGDSFTALVTDPDNPTVVPDGTVTFSSNGVALSFCENEALVPNEFNGSSPSFTKLSSATCSLEYSATGVFLIAATVVESDGATDVGSLEVDVIP